MALKYKHFFFYLLQWPPAFDINWIKHDVHNGCSVVYDICIALLIRHFIALKQFEFLALHLIIRNFFLMRIEWIPGLLIFFPFVHFVSWINFHSDYLWLQMSILYVSASMGTCISKRDNVFCNSKFYASHFYGSRYHSERYVQLFGAVFFYLFGLNIVKRRNKLLL